MKTNDKNIELWVISIKDQYSQPLVIYSNKNDCFKSEGFVEVFFIELIRKIDIDWFLLTFICNQFLIY